MEGKRHWLAWIAIGISGLALLVALIGGGIGPQIAAAGSDAPRSYAQQGSAPQSGSAAPGANAQQDMRQQGSGPQNGPAAPGSDMRGRSERSGDRGFGPGGWLGFPFRLNRGAFQIGMLALLVVLGVWLIRGRTAGGAPGSGRAEPAQGPPPEPQAPAGESYIDEPHEGE